MKYSIEENDKINELVKEWGGSPTMLERTSLKVSVLHRRESK